MAPTVQGTVIVIMGVRGAGKTKMRKGIPLSEEDRLPWLQVLCDALQERITSGKMAVLACSALRMKYREILRSSDLNYIRGKHSSSVKFVLLNVPAEVLADRLNKRLENREHYMPTFFVVV